MYYIMHLSLILMISLLILFINMFLMIIKNKNIEKNTPFECGFNIITKSSLPFSIPYYLIMLMFLIFDVEIILMLPMINYLSYLNSIIIYLSYMLMLWILLMTVMFEYLMNYLNWIF